jgi:CBS domain containing-hemolysin-like protein
LSFQVQLPAIDAALLASGAAGSLPANIGIALAAATLGSVFAAATTTLGGLPITRVSVMADESVGDSRQALLRYLADPTKILSRWLVGRVVCTALTAVLIGDTVHRLAASWAVPFAVLGTLASYGLLAEIATSIARRNQEKSVPFLLRVLRPIELLTIPVALPLAAIAKFTRRLVPPGEAIDGRTTEHEVEMLVAEGQKAGTLGEERAQMIQKVLDFNDLSAVDVMVPRTSLCAIDSTTSIDEVLRVITSNGHSRYPVFKGSIDNIIGLLYAKDLFRVMENGALRNTSVEQLIRTPVNFVPETKPITSLLREMRDRRLHMAVVVDDYGGVSGAVTLEDIIEQIIGDIQDEHDDEENPIVDLGDGRIVADAAVPIDELSRFLGVELPNDGDFVSLGGLLVSHAGHVPQAGTELEAFGVRFTIREADERKVSRVEIQVIAADHSHSESSNSEDDNSADD